MGILKNRKKANMGERIKQGMYNVGTGLVFATVEDAIGIPTDVEKAKTQEDIISFGSLVGGIGLPILFPGTEKIADPVATIGAYKTGKLIKIAEKFGLTDDAPATAGLGDRAALGSMFETKRNAERRNSGGSDRKPNPMG